MGDPLANKPNDKPLGMVQLLGCRCRCGHKWLPREADKPPRLPQMQERELEQTAKNEDREQGLANQPESKVLWFLRELGMTKK